MVSVYFRYPTGGIDPCFALAAAGPELPMHLYGPLELDNGQENIIVSPDGQNTINEVEAPYRKGRGGINANDSNSQDVFDGVNRYNNVHFPSRTSNRQEKLNSRNSRSTHKSMKHNAKMRKHHRIQQPGHDVQRFGCK